VTGTPSQGVRDQSKTNGILLQNDGTRIMLQKAMKGIPGIGCRSAVGQCNYHARCAI
jgi:hypothetical protein